MIDLARRVSSRDTGVSALKQLVSLFHERLIFCAQLNCPEIVGQVMLSPLNGAVMHFVLCSQMMANVHGQKIVSACGELLFLH
jgi:hypothetical protein